MKNIDFDRLISRASLSERAERYEDMVSDMKQAIKIAFEDKVELDVKARNLFSVAYKNLAGARRASWRILSSERQKLECKDPVQHEIAEKYVVQVEKELHEICDDVLNVIDSSILYPESLNTNVESKVFFLKMKADYYRYKAEVSEGDVLRKCTDESFHAYDSATKEASVLPPTHPVRLGLALNFSVFYYEIHKEHEKACALAKQAFDDAIAELDQLSEDHYKDSTLIMQLLRDNLTLWTNQDDNTQMDEQAEQEGFEKEEENEATPY
ncbi:14-3-3-like signal transduction protein [Hamiltosporidium tvaerminnensis]|uniref:14-3-3-like signal transduction protein n=2 Tax=Hamiltosporidium TaxID=1176354 RepID=A0A4Q9L7H7_9MICR|nr:14-3-3 protein [Hamiltosporidium tvaerminnensis]TBU03370.1 14-3-3-like signal transduction protein [Hamiltosporidium tvaerminnensis]TBU03649.1 14-3-3-like signal transduction protein [Hamiltosporidium magnivora]TBU09096.1 14-3-3-like signal transduction protein [Hamiltosporidium magnivora]TBU20202.1 14-3-3-like signal transduction protein [Hamiltosporidium tvaerminnensis]